MALKKAFKREKKIKGSKDQGVPQYSRTVQARRRSHRAIDEHGGNGETWRKSRSSNNRQIPTWIFHIQMDAGIKSLANSSFPAIAFLFEYGITGIVGNRK